MLIILSNTIIMNQIYFNKYLKYKKKYLNLKNNYQQFGGSSIISYFNNRLIFNEKTKQTTYYADFLEKDINFLQIKKDFIY